MLLIDSHRLCIAPMMQYTDRHFRYLMRLITRHTFLYTEMVTSAAIIHGHRDRHLQFDPIEHPIALQVGGSDPTELSECARIAEDHGYDEINLNVGCPSERVQSGRFGACLMAEPELVAKCVQSMQANVSIPVTVKTRIGIDHFDTYDFLRHFTYLMKEAGCKRVIVHARKAWLKGLSPKENRTIPPLSYETVYQLKSEFSDLPMVINGGIQNLTEVNAHLGFVDGVMLGRIAYSEPYLFATVDRDFYNVNSEINSRLSIAKQFQDYFRKEFSKGTSVSSLLKPLLGLYQGVQGARIWRRTLSDHRFIKQKGIDLIDEALAFVPPYAAITGDIP
jgi:tRNA-dihydrouridine synthase A